MKKLIITFFIMLFIATIVFSQSEATRFYNVNNTATPPTIDGVISSGEYADADPAQGEFRLLRTPVPGTLATENIQFQALQNAQNLYIVITTDDNDFSLAAATADDSMSFNDDMELFFDPGDINENKGGDTEDDSYQLAIPMISGTRAANTPGPPFYSSAARYDSLFGGTNYNPPNPAFAVDATPGNAVVEIAIPFGILSVDTYGGTHSGTESDLEHIQAPLAGERWAFNICRISGAGGELPIWNYHTGDGATAYLSEKPYGELIFEGATKTKTYELYE